MESHDCGTHETHEHPFRTAGSRPLERLAPRCRKCLHTDHFMKCTECECAGIGPSLRAHALMAVALAILCVCQSGVRAAVVSVGPFVLLWLGWYGVARLRFAQRLRAGVLFDDDDLPPG